MPPPNPTQNLRNAPIQDLVVVLLKQFQRLLKERGVSLTLAQMEAIGQASAGERDYPPQTETARRLLVELIEESLAYLQERFGWSFGASLARDMTSIDDWQTTADFLEIANHKSNAELRISAGASLLVMLGDVSWAHLLLDVIDADAGAQDVDAMFALRALAHVDDGDWDAPDWYAHQVARYR